MMSRNLIIAIVVVVGIIVLSTAVYMRGTNSKQIVEKITPTPTKTPNEEVVSSIKDAIAGSRSVVCEFNDSALTVKGYIKDGMVKEEVAASSSAKSGEVLIKDKKIYFWNAQSAIVMDLPEQDAKDVEDKTSDLTSDPKQALSQLDKYKNDCHYADVDDKVFDLPTGIKFQDVSLIQKSLPFVTSFPTISKTQ